jgi:nucleotide-binding universal stress UspA family protein
MTADAPVLIAYDGSDTARRAVQEAGKLFGSRQVLVVTVWEPGLAYEAEVPITDLDMPAVPVDIEGARELADEVKVADTVVELARKRGVAAIVVGSRGLRGLRARLEGSTSNAVLRHAPCPVVVVHDD